MTHSDSPSIVNVSNIASAEFRIQPPAAATDSVQLWKIDLDALAGAVDRWQSLLSSDEKDRAARFHFERDRLHFCTARALLRTILAAYVQTSPRQIGFRYADRGKPELADPHAASGVTFNLSHSGGAALIGVTRGYAIGVDIEKVRDDFDTAAIARRFFSPREQEELAALPRDEQHRAFFRCWTLKEAFIKALGEGLSHPLHQFDVSLDQRGPVSLITRPNSAEANRWQLQGVEAGAEYAAAIARLRRPRL